ncbi:MAG: hypothetical protein Q7O66_10730 [Dehalococcoidia bacterium]|nr:hypothetical protein [Dehalococcoidia bacterium]
MGVSTIGTGVIEGGKRVGVMDAVEGDELGITDVPAVGVFVAGSGVRVGDGVTIVAVAEALAGSGAILELLSPSET